MENLGSGFKVRRSRLRARGFSEKEPSIAATNQRVLKRGLYGAPCLQVCVLGEGLRVGGLSSTERILLDSHAASLD